MPQFYYNPETICRSMGMGSFRNDALDLESDFVRLLQMPSFAPEVCFTITPNTLEVVVALEQIWSLTYNLRLDLRKPTPALRIPTAREHLRFPDGSLDKFIDGFAVGCHSLVVTICDGSPFECLVRRHGELSSYKGNAVDDEHFLDLKRELIRLAYETAENPYVRQGLTDAFSYPSRASLSRREKYSPTPTQFLGVYGEETARRDFFTLLDRAAQRDPLPGENL